MKPALKSALRLVRKSVGYRFVGHVLFFMLFVAILIFCAWFKSTAWNEPLGADGLFLSVVLFYIIYKALPLIEKLINK